MLRFKKKKSVSNFKKRKYIDSPRYYTQLYAASKKPVTSALEERKVRKRRARHDQRKFLSSLLNSIRILYSKRTIYALLAFTLIVFVYLLLRTSNFFSVSSFEVYGNEKISKEEVLVATAGYAHRNLFTFSVGEVEKNIEENFIFVKEVYVRKKLPDTLEIEIIERKPLFVLTSFSGSYIFDSEYKLLYTIENDSLELLPYEIQVLGGNADPNDSYIKERYLLKATDSDLKTSSWEDVSLEEKQSILLEVEGEVKSQLQAYLNLAKQNIPSEYQELPQVIFYEEQSFPQDTFIDLPKVTFSSELIQKLSEYFEISKLTWVSDYSVEVVLAENKILLISRTRDLEEQLSDFMLLVKKGAFERGSIIDVRVSTLSVE